MEIEETTDRIVALAVVRLLPWIIQSSTKSLARAAVSFLP